MKTNKKVFNANTLVDNLSLAQLYNMYAELVKHKEALEKVVADLKPLYNSLTQSELDDVSSFQETLFNLEDNLACIGIACMVLEAKVFTNDNKICLN